MLMLFQLSNAVQKKTQKPKPGPSQLLRQAQGNMFVEHMFLYDSLLQLGAHWWRLKNTSIEQPPPQHNSPMGLALGTKAKC